MKFVLLFGSIMYGGHPGYAQLYPDLTSCHIAARAFANPMSATRDAVLGCIPLVNGLDIEFQTKPKGEPIE